MSERDRGESEILDEQYGLIFDGVGTQAERSELVRRSSDRLTRSGVARDRTFVELAPAVHQSG